MERVHTVATMVFPVCIYECDNQTIKKAERRIIDVFELWCWAVADGQRPSQTAGATALCTPEWAMSPPVRTGAEIKK